MVYAYAVDNLEFQAAHFDVRKDIERVWQFHERFGAERIGETQLDYFYSLGRATIDRYRECYKIFLTVHIIIEPFK